MKDLSQDEFSLAPGIVMLNHASYGLASRRVISAAQAMQYEIDSDPTARLGAALLGPLRRHSELLAETIGLRPAGMTLCTNATSGAAAIISSAALNESSTVVALETEYSSILRAWEVAAERSGATMIRIPVRLPFDGPEQLIEQMEAAVPGDIAYLQTSLVSSSSAVRFPVSELAAWAHDRGGRFVLDAAHGPGHVPFDPGGWDADAIFGTVHKWFPTLRPVGFLWLKDDLIETVRPAEVSLTWDAADLVERFSWPGTFDPVSRLSLPVAVEQWRQWAGRGAWEECAGLGDAAVEALTSIGARPTATPSYQPPRLRAFVLDRLTVSDVKELMTRAGIRPWVGPGADGECILRIATHVYNDLTDIEAVVSQLKGALR
ncbi:aminotransferase class V-fold PLP-dependent enzyme [Herbidospora cretacea]|uniref:aminotransferase class V-fold PLP-dependent enzyme n=1 Tax=Herbidospora cretacea TaxID=28444 RepID=UPI0007739B5B|nr:aminotransferase class V-fold PLP-dependent enzyme [Herbidospora cretacea]